MSFEPTADTDEAPSPATLPPATLRRELFQLRELLARGEAVLQLGTRDFPPRLSPPGQLIGREPEIRAVRTAFDRALDGRSSGLFVAGGPVVGKSALMGELRTLVTARRGWFVSGKFDQYRRDATTGAVNPGTGCACSTAARRTRD
jgi:hypothetical protein